MDQFIETIRTEEGVRTLRLTGPFTLSAIFDFQSVARSEDVPITASCQRLKKKYALAGASDRLQTLFAAAGVENILRYPSVSEARNALVGQACFRRTLKNA